MSPDRSNEWLLSIRTGLAAMRTLLIAVKIVMHSRLYGGNKT